MKKTFLCFLFLSLAVLTSYAQEKVKPLPPDQAFPFSAHVSYPNRLIIQWNIAKGYYLYRHRLHVANSLEKRIPVSLPPGMARQDALQGHYQVYTGALEVVVPLTPADQWLTVEYQGCSSQGFCYSPIKKNLHLNAGHLSVQPMFSAAPSEQAYAEMLFTHHSLFIIVMTFLGLGLLLAFTPCVLPMVPILSGIIIGHHKKSPRTKMFGLSLAYVLGMAITYAIAGMVVALIGHRIQTVLQKPWVIVLFSGIFVLLALSLLGVYEFQLPSRWQKRLTDLSNRQKGGTYFGVFLMGSISSLIVSPCISPALVGVLAYIAHTGNAGLGALALLSLGIGMGLPLLLVGASVEKLLPKAGAWMQTIERSVGVIMLGFAIWLLSRVIPGPLALVLWSLLLITTALIVGDFKKAVSQWQHLRHGFASVLLIYGLILFAGALLGNSDPLRPWENWRSSFNAELPPAQLAWITLKDMTQFNQALAQARQERKEVILDFSAEWCESCVYMNRHVFTQMKVKQLLAHFILLRNDMTENNSFDEALMRRFQVVAPPTILFFAADGSELEAERLIGEVTAEELIAHIKKYEEMRRVN
jgi:thiol:disulfide interchange protein DsbD